MLTNNYVLHLIISTDLIEYLGYAGSPLRFTYVVKYKYKLYKWNAFLYETSNFNSETKRLKNPCNIDIDKDNSQMMRVENAEIGAKPTETSKS